MTARRVVLTALLTVAAVSGVVAVAADLSAPRGVYPLPLQIWLDLIGVAWAASGAVVVLGRPRHVLGWLVVAVGTVTQASLAEEAVRRATGTPDAPAGHLLSFVSGTGIFLMLGLLPLLYPSGTLPSRRWRPLAATIALGALAQMLQWLFSRLADWPWPFDAGERVGVVAWVPFTIYAVATVVGWVLTGVRITRAASPERQQLVLLLVAVALPLLLSALGEATLVQWFMATSLMLLPTAIAVGILRYRMLGIELVLRRGLLYAALTLCVVAVYATLTWLGARYVGGEQLPTVAAAALVAVGLLPLRARLQRWVDLLVYGRRRDPLTAVADLGAVVEAAAPHSRAGELVVRVRLAVRAPGARVVDPGGRELAVSGTVADADPATAHVPLSVGGVEVGRLEVGARTPGEGYGRADLRLLHALGPHVAVALQTADLAAALERERDQVLSARAGERDRLRHDLHDGLGPSLTGMALGLRAADDALTAGDAARAREIVTVVRAEIDRAVEEIGRIVDDLRPAPLESTSLAAALELAFAGRPAPPMITIRAQDHDFLPVHVEDAAYRIAVEAIHNAVRHARAAHVRVTVGVTEEGLALEVVDDGIGVPVHVTEGVGLRSMRMRAAAVGGTLTIDGRDGTTVRLSVPLPSRVPT